MLKDVVLIHIVGISGSGMSGIAKLLKDRGLRVQGSDLANSHHIGNIQLLRDLGIEVFIGQRAENLGDAELVLRSTAIPESNPEVIAARERGIQIINRAEMLAELLRSHSTIAISGSFGKTTTTSFTGALLEAGGIDPTVVVGAFINAYNSNLPINIAVILNIGQEHLNKYGDSFDALKAAFQQFLNNTPFDSYGVVCIDDPIVRSLASAVQNLRIITYGKDDQAEVRFLNVRVQSMKSTFDVRIRQPTTGEISELKDISIPIAGQHFVSNATAAIAIAHEFGISGETIRQAFAKWGGIERRFVLTGTWNGVTIFDDYAHHPEEVRVTLKAARQFHPGGRLIASYHARGPLRLSTLFEDFARGFDDADIVLIVGHPDFTQAPGGISWQALVERIHALGHGDVRFVDSEPELLSTLHTTAKPGDIVITMGPGTTTHWAASIPAELEKLS
ncbi:hypothetical protein ABW20_dc0108055 [Dactylellina cionopaga]|nr:hypothetical protein ABW20_dc0108055 [Dactylellina cionopaga]